MKLLIAMMSAFFVIVTASGCAGSRPAPYSEQYAAALESQAVASTEVADLSAFRALFSNLKADDVAEQVRRVYAPRAYFNDTLHTFESHDELAEYLADTGARADRVDIDYLNQWQSDSDVFLRWRMRTVFTVLGKEKDITSYGISHLRLNAEGQVVLHQDYWDSAEGLLRHLPVSGPAINWIRKKL